MLLLKDPLLLLVFAVLTIELVLPELVNLIRRIVFRCGSRRGCPLNLLLRSCGERGSFVIDGKEVGRILRKLGDANKTGEVSEVRAFVVELD